jgi:cadmium resistance protein CadD (predicted permease)
MLTEILASVGLVLGSFVATNVDNLVLLVGWLSIHRTGSRSILIGYCLGMGALLALAFGFGLAANLIPIEFIGYLGVVPIALGLKLLADRWRKREHAAVGTLETGGALSVAVAITQLANGVDTVLVFAPLLADSSERIDFLIVASFGLIALLWFGLARMLSTRAARLESFERVGEWLAPLVMVGIGIYILTNTASDVLPDA